MRLLLLVLALLLALIQYPLWWGKGGWYAVWDMQQQLAQQREANAAMQARNAAMQAEVQDLEGGSEAIEERARGELGMMRDGEVFVQILPPGTEMPQAAPKPVAKPGRP